jgi:hypothetical protein
MVLEVLSRCTRTPEDCYFCLWDGWGVHESDGARTPDVGTGDLEAEPGIDPSFSPPASREPMVVVPNRSYLLFHGTVTDLGDAGPAPAWPGQLGEARADPAFIWPADQAWCVANDVDPHWAGIGASAQAIDELVADPRLDVVRADPRARQPRYR